MRILIFICTLAFTTGAWAGNHDAEEPTIELIEIRCNWGKVTVQAITSTTVQGAIRGEKFDPARHTFYTEIKAVTYHELAVVRSTAGWRAQVIFDV